MKKVENLFDKSLKKIDTSKLSSPFAVTFTVTRRCNYLCRHCYNMSGNNIAEELTDDELLSIAKQIADLHPTDVCLCGGEPLVRGNVIYDIIKILNGNCGSINIVSNGFLIDDDVAK